MTDPDEISRIDRENVQTFREDAAHLDDIGLPEAARAARQSADEIEERLKTRGPNHHHFEEGSALMDVDLTKDQEAALEALRTAEPVKIPLHWTESQKHFVQHPLDDLVRLGYAYVDAQGWYRFLPPTTPKPPREIKPGDRVVREYLAEGLIIVREIVEIAQIATVPGHRQMYRAIDTNGGTHTWRAVSTHAVVVG